MGLKSDVSIFISKEQALCIAVKLQPWFKQTLTHKRIVFHNFTIADISINSHENGTVSSW
jgi:hypothetical protein